MKKLDINDLINALTKYNLIPVEFKILHSCKDVSNTINLYYILVDRTYTIFAPPGYIILASIRAGDKDIICFSEL